MLFRNRLVEALATRHGDFAAFDREWRDSVGDYARRWRALGLDGIQEFPAAECNLPARPSLELAARGSLVAPFGLTWESHEEARRWALGVLSGRTTFAADASQIAPGRDISLPIAIVQVGWFENPHTPNRRYTKDARVAVISPAELLDGDQGRVNPDTVIGLRRTQMEIEQALDFLNRQAGWRERRERMPVAFFDGSFTYFASFPLPKIREQYAVSIAMLMEWSRQTEIPVVGFVDESYARDLVRWSDVHAGRNLAHRYPYDAQVLRTRIDGDDPLLAGWGDRTCCFESLADAPEPPTIGFVYLQTTGEGTPARVEFPVWVREAGLVDELIDTVRAECVTGLGYPYALETADQTAVIRVRDREALLRELQNFAGENSWDFRVSSKSASKLRRR